MPNSTLPSPESASRPSLLNQPLPFWESRVPFIVLATLAGFILSICAPLVFKVIDAPKFQWIVNPILWFVLLIASFSIWFVLSFTGSPSSLAKQRECFRFAYSLTVVSFIILVFPYLNVWKPDISGSVSLVRGCIVADPKPGNAESQMGSASIKCPATPSMTDLERDSEAYPWLLTIGGFVGQTSCYATEPTTKVVSEAACAKDDYTNAQRHSRITSGLVVPFYVVFLAFIGGAVSLSRRIPEFQKRSSPEYTTTSTLPALAPMLPYEAREAVVFQIMQMLSAPFIAITAYWVIAPASIAASIGLAFVSGFSSETILLLIRGVVDGIRPQSAPATAAATGKASTSSDTGTPSTNEVIIRVAVHADAPVDLGSMTLTSDGAPVTLSSDGFVELSLQVGKEHTLVASAKSSGRALSATLTITLTVDDEAKPLTLQLVPVDS